MFNTNSWQALFLEVRDVVFLSSRQLCNNIDEVIDTSTADGPLLHLPLGEIAQQLRAGRPESKLVPACPVFQKSCYPTG